MTIPSSTRPGPRHARRRRRRMDLHGRLHPGRCLGKHLLGKRLDPCAVEPQVVTAGAPDTPADQIAYTPPPCSRHRVFDGRPDARASVNPARRGGPMTRNRSWWASVLVASAVAVI